jgi:hypothetical protein
LEFQCPFGTLPVVAEQASDPVEALDDGVDMDMEGLSGFGLAHAAGEVDAQGVDELGAALGVVLEDRPECALDVGGEVGVLAQEYAEEAEVGQSRAVSCLPERAQGGQAAQCLGVGLGEGGRSCGRARGADCDGGSGCKRFRRWTRSPPPGRWSLSGARASRLRCSRRSTGGCWRCWRGSRARKGCGRKYWQLQMDGDVDQQEGGEDVVRDVLTEPGADRGE